MKKGGRMTRRNKTLVAKRVDRRNKWLELKNQKFDQFGDRLIDFSFGEGEDLVLPEIREILISEILSDRSDDSKSTIDFFKRNVLEYLRIMFGIDELNENEVVHCLGTKSALSMIPFGFVESGDVVLTTVPGYAALGLHAGYLGAKIISVPLSRQNGFFPDLNLIPKRIAEKAKLFYINYPNNPTGVVGNTFLFDELIEFATRYNIILVHDASCAAVVFNGFCCSILSRPGGKDVAIELHSLTKAFGLSAWRIGFAVGNRKLINVFESVRNNFESGKFRILQKAAAQLLMRKDLIDIQCVKYKKMMDDLLSLLEKIGFDTAMTGNTLYCYVPAPRRIGTFDFTSAKAVADYLLKELSIVVVPWDEVEPSLRFSLTPFFDGRVDFWSTLKALEERLDFVRLEWQ